MMWVHNTVCDFNIVHFVIRATLITIITFTSIHFSTDFASSNESHPVHLVVVRWNLQTKFKIIYYFVMELMC